MSTIQIGTNISDLFGASESWITQHIQDRRREGQAVCVQVKVQESGVDMVLATPACAAVGGGSGRPPNSIESKIFQLWDKLGLNANDFSPGKVIAFIKQLSGLL